VVRIETHHSFPNADVRDPDFPGRFLLWSHDVQIEVWELIASSKETLAQSRALMAEADRMLALR
jgi:hypothetical protein